MVSSPAQTEREGGLRTIRLFIVEDDADFRYLIEQTVSAQPDIVVAGCCASGKEAVEAAKSLRPDLVLMDLCLAGGAPDGAEAARRIRLETAAKIVILTASDQPETVIRASVRAFASGYVLKSQFSLLVPTLQETARGPTPQSHMICSAILGVLTPAESAVFRQMVGQEVALHSSAKTIANQQTSILHKLELPDRRALNHVFSAYF